MPTTLRILGVDHHLCSLNLTRERIEEASPTTLDRYIKLSEMELEIANIKQAHGIAYGIECVLKELKAQRKINDNRASREFGCICG